MNYYLFYFYFKIFLLLYVLYIPGLFCLFRKAGKNGWISLIPVYNLVVITRIIKRPWWLIVLLPVPLVGEIVGVYIYLEFITGFKKHNFPELLLAAFFPFIWINYLGFSQKTVYRPKRIKQSGLIVKTVILSGIGIILPYLVRLLLFVPFLNTTSSMENTLKKGDYIFVSKTSLGPRIPDYFYSGNTYVPHKRFWYNKPVQINDLLVFNNPVGDTVVTKTENISYYRLLRKYGHDKINASKETLGKIEYRSLDKRSPWVKRCIALPGDTLVIIRGEIYVNGRSFKAPATVKYTYYLEITTSHLNKNIIDQYKLSQINQMEKPGSFYVNMTKAAKSALEKQKFVIRIRRIYDEPNQWEKDVFPYAKDYPWNRDNLGPIVIPAKGVPLKLNLHTLPLYFRLITAYEGKKIRVEGNRIFVDGEETDRYTPVMNYYWVMGDNRNNAIDSRYWGFLPEDHIIGKATCLLYSQQTGRLFPKLK